MSAADQHRQFVDCNCGSADKCPQGKTGARTRCFIPVERASVGAVSVQRLITEVERPSPPQPPQAICKGDWTLGTACGRCERCVTTAPEVISRLLDNVRQCEGQLGVIFACVPLPVGGIAGVDPANPNVRWDISDEFKVRCFEEIRRVLHREKP